MAFPGNSNILFKTAILRNTSGLLFLRLSVEQSWRFSVPQMQSAGNIRISVQKNLRKLPGKNLFWCVFVFVFCFFFCFVFGFRYQKTFWWIVFGNFLKYFRTVVLRNSFRQLLLEGFLFTEAVAQKFSSLISSWELWEIFSNSCFKIIWESCCS